MYLYGIVGNLEGGAFTVDLCGDCVAVRRVELKGFEGTVPDVFAGAARVGACGFDLLKHVVQLLFNRLVLGYRLAALFAFARIRQRLLKRCACETRRDGGDATRRDTENLVEGDIARVRM